MNLETGSVIQNSRLKEIFEGVGVLHHYKGENTTTIEKFAVSSRDKDACNFEVFMDNVSIVKSFGIFKENSTYDISVNDEVVKTVTYTNNTFGDSNFTYNGHEIRVNFVDRNNTSIKQFIKSEQGSFLNLYINSTKIN